MKDTALYEHLLGLKAPWSVKKVDLSLAFAIALWESLLRNFIRLTLPIISMVITF